MPKAGYVYILTGKTKCLYVGVTSNLPVRMFKHITKYYPKSFTARYNINRLVYWEHCEYISSAIAREKTIKKWGRHKKIALVESINPTWRNLIYDLTDEADKWYEMINSKPGSDSFDEED